MTRICSKSISGISVSFNEVLMIKIVVEAFMGQVARVDFYTDIWFIVLSAKCHLDGMTIATCISISLMLTYPIYKIFRLLKLNRNLKHTLPKIERNWKLSFIRENMMLAVVLDSFCITNYEYLCKFNIFFPRIMGATTLFFQDIPQVSIILNDFHY